MQPAMPRLLLVEKSAVLPESWCRAMSELIIYLFREGFSPEQIAGKLRRMKINFEEAYVRRETVYNAIYALPVGELRK
jgi:IS30 family transposase